MRAVTPGTLRMSLLQALLINLGSIVVPGLLLYALLARLAAHRQKRLGWFMLEAFSFGILLLCLLEVLSWDFFPPLPRSVEAGITFGAYLSFAFVALRAADLLIIEAILVDRKGMYFPRILRWLVIAFGLVMTGLVMLHTVLGINVVALVAVPTVLTAILGFAMKDTLERLVSGIILGRLIHEGDWVTLLDHEGRVASITLGHITLTTREGHAIIIPNNMVAHHEIENYSRPFGHFACHVEVEAHYQHPPLKVCAILIESAQAVSGVLKDPEPVSYTDGFKESGIEYRLKFWISDFTARPTIESDVRSYIWFAFQRHGIQIPFPQRVIHTAPNVDDEAERARRLAAIHDQLQRIDFLKALDRASLDDLARSAETRTYLPQEAVVRQGDPGDEFFIVTSGEAEVLLDMNGKPTQVATLKPGQFFGEMALLTGEPRSATVRAQTQLSVLVLSKPAMSRVFTADPGLIEQISAILAERQYRTSTAREAAGRLSPDEETKKKTRTLGTRIRKFFGL
jgi:small-conductance mechanosensitive channel/CRP-like cAMP-binding protein